MRIAIIGAGVSGLATAFNLRDHAEVVVFEARDRVGGNIRSERIEDCLVEWGPNGFLDNEPATLKLVQDLGLGDRLLRAREEAAIRYVWRAGRLRPLPAKPTAFLTGDVLSLSGRLRALLEPWTKPSTEADESVYNFASRHLGKQAAEILVDAFVTGIFAGDPKRLSLKSAFPRLQALEAEFGSLIKGARQRGGGVGPRGVLTSFDDGLDVLVRELAKRVDVRLNHPLDRLPDGFDHIICTVPSPRAADLVDGELAQLLRQIPTAPVVVVALMFKNPPPVEDAFGFLVPRGQGLRILGTLYDSSIFPGRAPEGMRSFRTLIGGRRDPDVIELSDDEILAIVADDLHRAWGSFPDPHHTHVIRHPLGIAQYEIGHADLLRRIEAACPPHLHLAGSSYHGVALNACVKEALSDWPDIPIGLAQDPQHPSQT